MLHEEGLDDVVCELLRLGDVDLDLSRVGDPRRPHRVGRPAGHASASSASTSACPTPTCRWSRPCKHGGFHHGAEVEIEWIQAEEVEGLLAEGRLRDLDGIVIPGGFGERGIEGKIAAAGYAREHDIPCLGLCLGLQMMTIEYARNVLGLAGANSSEFDPTTPHPVIDLMDTQRDVTDMGGTMRLGAYVAQLAEGSQVAEAYGTHGRVRAPPPPLRVQPQVPGPLRRQRRSGARARRPTAVSSSSSSSRDHPFWVGTQAHPELKSRPTRPAPLFREFVGAALARAEGRSPHLFDLDAEPLAPPSAH